MKNLLAKITMYKGKFEAVAGFRDGQGLLPVIVGDNLKQVLEILEDYAPRKDIELEMN